MKKSLSFLIILSALFFASTNFTLAEDSKGPFWKYETLSVKKGKTFNVTVNSNPSTGYKWYYLMEPNEKSVKLIKSTYSSESSDPDLVGGGGEEVFKFKSLKKGTTQLLLIRIPPGNLNSAQFLNVTVTIL